MLEASKAACTGGGRRREMLPDLLARRCSTCNHSSHATDAKKTVQSHSPGNPLRLRGKVLLQMHSCGTTTTTTTATPACVNTPLYTKTSGSLSGGGMIPAWESEDLQLDDMEIGVYSGGTGGCLGI